MHKGQNPPQPDLSPSRPPAVWSQFDSPTPAFGSTNSGAVRHLWPEPGCSPALSGPGEARSDTSGTSMESADTATMHHSEALHPAGTHSNPIPSAVLSKPGWSIPPQVHPPPQPTPQDGSMARPLSSSILASAQQQRAGRSMAYPDRTASGHIFEVPPSPMVNNVTFIPTSQAPALLPAVNPPTQVERAASLGPHAPLQRGSPPPSIDQAAAATAVATPSPALGASRRRGRNPSVDKGGQGGRDSAAHKERSSRFRGVTKHRRSGRWEAHIWVKELGRQVYLGGYEHEEHAAEAYDVAALKCKGFKVKTNFDIDRYTDLTECMDSISLEELIMAVRRQSQGFSRGTSAYRGVTHHPSGRWEARIGIPGSKHIYLGLFNLEKEAAQAYDRALVRLRGTAAATNFALSDYRSDLAEYHKMQQTVLQSDKDMSALLGSNSNFERWIKNGFSAEDLATSSHDSEDILSQGTVAGIGGVLRATARRKSNRVRSRSRSPCHRPGAGAGGGEQSEQDQSTGDDACEHQSGDWGVDPSDQICATQNMVHVT
ncbi:hypothetical protein ABBQ38_001075 [Trebouxia sp. C0009 RCD-2024]